jgi:hypothetical protein
VCINIFIILWQVGGGVQLINKHPLGHGILRQSAVDQLPLVLDPTDFLSD